MEEHRSIWRASAELHAHRALEGEINADVAVIGAGMAGVLIAHRLKRRGARVVVLEADRIASGQTQNTTAKLTSQHGMLYDALIRRFGLDTARQYALANGQAIDEYAALIRELDIDCGFAEAPAYLYSLVSDEPMQREAEAARACGIDAHFTADTELPFDVAGAVHFDRQAMLHPLKLIGALSGELEIYEHSRVTDVRERRAVTEHGAVNAESIVFAAHYPFVNVPGWYFMRMHQQRSYVLALKSDWLPRGMYLGVDDGGLSFRTAEGLLLLGGGSHRTGENSAGGRYDALIRRAGELVPGSKPVARWSAQDCITMDGLPYIGQFCQSTSSWYVATGFAKWGMSLSMVSALAIAGLICGDAPSWAQAFSPLRLKLSASARSLATDTAQALKGLSRELLSLPQTTLDELPPGHGGIVEAQGRKAGVYKDGEGRCHIVSTRCPHLGCQLEWNPDELSWDCPCHGSRFSYDGTLINGPAQEGIK